MKQKWHALRRLRQPSSIQFKLSFGALWACAMSSKFLQLVSFFMVLM